MRTKTRIIGSLALCLSAAVTSIAVADGDEGSAPPNQDLPQIAAVEPAASAAMSALSDTRGTEDEIPDELAARLDARASFGMNTALSRAASGGASNVLYLVPARDHVCSVLTVGDGAGISCARTDDIAAGVAGPATGTVAGGIAILGMVPNGVESALLETGQDDSQNIEVENNAYFAVVPAGTTLRAVSYDGPSGEVRFPIYDPSLPGRE